MQNVIEYIRSYLTFWPDVSDRIWILQIMSILICGMLVTLSLCTQSWRATPFYKACMGDRAKLPAWQRNAANKQPIPVLPSFLRPAGCSTYMAEHLKALYPDGEILSNGSFVLRFKGGRSAAYFAALTCTCGIWPSNESYGFSCCEAGCPNRQTRPCKDCKYSEKLAKSLQDYFDDIVSEGRVHIMGVWPDGESVISYVLDCATQYKIDHAMSGSLYGRANVASAMWHSGEQGALTCLYIEARSYKGTYDEVLMHMDCKIPPFEYKPVVLEWPPNGPVTVVHTLEP